MRGWTCLLCASGLLFGCNGSNDGDSSETVGNAEDDQTDAGEPTSATEDDAKDDEASGVADEAAGEDGPSVTTGDDSQTPTGPPGNPTLPDDDETPGDGTNPNPGAPTGTATQVSPGPSAVPNPPTATDPTGMNPSPLIDAGATDGPNPPTASTDASVPEVTAPVEPEPPEAGSTETALGICGEEPCQVQCREPDLYPELDSDDCLVTCIGAMVIDTQDKVDELAAMQCDVLEATVLVRGSEVTSLAGLESVRQVTFGLQVTETGLTGLEGLDSVEWLGGSLIIHDNPLLQDLDGLSSARGGLTGNVDIRLNPLLIDISGLSAMVFGEVSLAVSLNDSLTSLDGLQGVTSTRSVTVRDQLALLDLAGLAELTSTGVLLLTNNDALRSASLPNLEVATGVDVLSNPELQSISAPKLREVDTIRLGSNTVLTDVHFDGMQTLSTLTATLNPALAECQLDALAALAGGCTCSGNDATTSCP